MSAIFFFFTIIKIDEALSLIFRDHPCIVSSNLLCEEKRDSEEKEKQTARRNLKMHLAIRHRI